eukprot:CAMPEP_0206273900 /NCGR_PEP_ID=MMETSP0047_2-20121206/34862_1 /ASSEMBLY_ACC=CAM_ASM_000192 /TAXON_ID=195065 /ORGANISM="Chroomonas mesostigmatica_cf, Strain CCMP1168" /LENGTH=172 /DNA_ID=CAMNT_0053703067 /DNA_START=42 /DNA_END=557 /DNA_ORIENTATION=-
MAAAKFFDDEYYSNRHWAKIGGISLEELNSLELDFLFLLTFQLNVKVEDYKAFLCTMLPKEEEYASANLRAHSSPHVASGRQGEQEAAHAAGGPRSPTVKSQAGSGSRGAAQKRLSNVGSLRRAHASGNNTTFEDTDMARSKDHQQSEGVSIPGPLPSLTSLTKGSINFFSR